MYGDIRFQEYIYIYIYIYNNYDMFCNILQYKYSQPVGRHGMRAQLVLPSLVLRLRRFLTPRMH